MFFWTRLKRFVLAVAMCLFIGGLAVYSQTSGQIRTDPPPSPKPVTPSSQSAPLPEPTLVITPPYEVRATGGWGKMLVYDLGPRGERSSKSPRNPRQQEPIHQFKEVELESTWVVVTGVVDHKAIRDSAIRSGFGDPDSLPLQLLHTDRLAAADPET